MTLCKVWNVIGYILYMKIYTIAASLALWEGHKNFIFSVLFEEKPEIYFLKMSSESKSDEKFLGRFELKNQNFWLVLWNSFGNMTNRTPIFMLLK